MAQAGTAFVDIEARTDQLGAAILDALSSIEATVTPEADTSAVTSELDDAIASIDGTITGDVLADTSEAQAALDTLDGGTIEETVTADTSQAEESIGSLAGSIESAVGALGDLGGGGGAAGAASGALGGFTTSALEAAGASAALVTGVGALALGVGLSVDAAMDAQVVAAQTTAMLDSTGAAAYLSAGAISSLGEEVLGYSGFSDEAVASGENMLLMFDNVSSQAAVNAGVFERTTRLGADLSTVMGGDVTNAIRTLGRAIDDPTAGMGRLRRAGIQLTESQQQQIRSMQESGDLLGAQERLLDIVDGKVGGLAESYGDTLAGQLDIAGEKFDNVKEEMGNSFLPTIEATVGPTLDLADAIATAASAAGLFTGPMSSMRQSLDAGGVEGWTAQLLVGGPALNDWSTAAADAAKAAGQLTPEMDKASDDLDELNRSLEDYVNAVTGLPGAQRDLRQSFADLTTAMTTGDWNDQAVAMEGIVESTAATIDKQREMGATTAELDATIYGSIATLAQMRDAGVITGAQFDRLSGQIRDVPHQATTEVRTPGIDGALRQLREVKTTIDGIDRNIVVQVSVPNLGAIAADVAGAARALRSLDPPEAAAVLPSSPSSSRGTAVATADLVPVDEAGHRRRAGRPVRIEFHGPIIGTNPQALARWLGPAITAELRDLDRSGR